MTEPTSSEFVGIDIGGTKVAGVRIARDGKVLERSRSFTPAEPEKFLEAAHEAADALRTEGVAAVGLGLAGLVRWPEGVFAWGPHVAGTGVPARDEMSELVGLPVVVDNDANLTAYAEAVAGAGQGYDHIVLVTLGTGIGGGIVINGEIYRGASFAGEFGHMTMRAEGPSCACGRQGCWETLASGPALARFAKEAVAVDPNSLFARRYPDPSSEDVIAAVRAGDATAFALVERVGRWFGLGLSTLITALDPDIVIVGGGLGSVGESLIDPARRAVQATLHGAPHRQPPPIVGAALGPDAGAIGAALLARDTVEVPTT